MSVQSTISNISTSAVGLYPESIYPQTQRKQEEKTISPPVQAPTEQVSLNITVSRSTADAIQRIGNISEFLNSTAQNIRQTDQGLTAAQTKVDKMKSIVGQILKNFPPFSDSEIDKQREALLMSYSSLQQELTKLTIPRPPTPVYDKVQHLWQNLFPNADGKLTTISLPDQAPASHVEAAAQQLESVSGQISAVKEELGKSVTG